MSIFFIKNLYFSYRGNQIDGEKSKNQLLNFCHLGPVGSCYSIFSEKHHIALKIFSLWPLQVSHFSISLKHYIIFPPFWPFNFVQCHVALFNREIHGSCKLDHIDKKFKNQNEIGLYLKGSKCKLPLIFLPFLFWGL